jgi:NAD(P)-dependent dehydrogenase (short-subunit alcohol dehydrogenase family)
MKNIENKVVIITGGSHGIGAGLVAAYRDQGWDVVANSRHPEDSDSSGVVTIEGDISKSDTVDRIIGGALERFGRIDTLVNNAGVFISKPFTEYSLEEFEFAIGVNLTGFFTLTQRVITEMLKRGQGHIVNITTTLVDYADARVPSVLTSLTKGGVASATRSLAIEYATRNIRVNAVSPGVIRTSPLQSDSDGALAALHPVNRIGQISDVVSGVLFLEAAPFITGEVLHIDGGQIAGHSSTCP